MDSVVSIAAGLKMIFRDAHFRLLFSVCPQALPVQPVHNLMLARTWIGHHIYAAPLLLLVIAAAMGARTSTSDGSVRQNIRAFGIELSFDGNTFINIGSDFNTEELFTDDTVYQQIDFLFDAAYSGVR